MRKYLIIGGVAGGATAAARLRRIDEHAHIIMLERENYISYANCGLPYYIGDVIKEREKLLVQTPESFFKRLNVEVRTKNEAIGIFPDEKKVKIKDIEKGDVYEERYDKLILSPGAEPIKPPIDGIGQEGVFTLRNVKDTDLIKAYVDNKKPRKAIVVGAGFIGLEMAENLHERGLDVTIVELADQVMAPLDFEMAAETHQHLKMKNIEFYLNDGVNSFKKEGGGLEAILQSGRKIQADLVVLSIGVKPEVRIAKQAGLKIAPSGGIQVNEYLQTTHPDIYAIGDAIAFPNPITGSYTNTYLAGPANRQGRIVADNIVFGNKRRYKGAIGTSIAKVFDITVASTGLNEKTLKKQNIPYQANITHGASHAGYYPGAMPQTLKIIFHPETGKLYGAQIVGYEGVDKRIDIIATVLKQGGDIYDLQEVEHAYAPPYSSAKDPVNIAGYAAENIIKGRVKTIDWKELRKLHMPDVVLLDVRTPDENSLGEIDGSLNIELDELRNRLDEIPKDKKIIVYCGVGLRGYFAACILEQEGFSDVYNLSGGYKTYEHATCKQSNEDIFESSYIDKSDHIYRKVTKNETIEPKSKSIKTIEVDACGLQCPGPILKLKQEIEKLDDGDRLVQKATDPGFIKDVASWCNLTGNQLINVESNKGLITAIIEKQKKDLEKNDRKTNNKTLVVFSDDLDRALASLVIANGAASTGKKVTMFFTFWGLNILKRERKPKVAKDLMGKMFGMMMPRHAGKLGLSKMNMMGMGATMMKQRMKVKKVGSLEEMIMVAQQNGVEMIACQMSMDVMGIHKDELIDGTEIGGVATYLEEAEQSNVNLFI